MIDAIRWIRFKEYFIRSPVDLLTIFSASPSLPHIIVVVPVHQIGSLCWWWYMEGEGGMFTLSRMRSAKLLNFFVMWVGKKAQTLIKILSGNKSFKNSPINTKAQEWNGKASEKFAISHINIHNWWPWVLHTWAVCVLFTSLFFVLVKPKVWNSIKKIPKVKLNMMKLF